MTNAKKYKTAEERIAAINLVEDGLKPCPFCGEHEIVETSECNYGLFIRRTAGPGGTPEGTWEFFEVECNGCGCRINRIGSTPQEAAAAWNRRAE